MSWLSPKLFKGRARELAAVGVKVAVPDAGVNWKLLRVIEVTTTVSAQAVDEAPSSNPNSRIGTKNLSDGTLI
jgi:hypothetical protein